VRIAENTAGIPVDRERGEYSYDQQGRPTEEPHASPVGGHVVPSGGIL
jgi:hypothetical protein